jgi:hypothetical protein
MGILARPGSLVIRTGATQSTSAQDDVATLYAFLGADAAVSTTGNTIPYRGESVQMPSAEAWLPENKADAIIGEGFMPLVPTRGRGSARLPRFQSIASPAAPLVGRWRLG